MILLIKSIKVKGFTRNRKGIVSFVPSYERKDPKPNKLHLAKEQKEAALKQYESGERLDDIASAVGMHPSTISKLAKEAGISRSRSEAQAVRAARDPVGRAEIGKKGAFHSEKNNSWYPTDSHYEYARMHQLEGDDEVLSWKRCTDRIAYEFEGGKFLYVPDLEVTRRNSVVSVEEIKPAKFVTHPKNQAKFSAARKFYGNEKEFHVVTETEIGRRNIDRLTDVGHSEVPIEVRKRRKVEAANRYMAKKTPEERAAVNEAARVRELAKRQAMSPSEREAYNQAARERRAAKKIQKLTKSDPIVIFFDYNAIRKTTLEQS